MATLRRIDGTYVLDWYDDDGERHRDTLGKIGVLQDRDAKRLLKIKQAELTPGVQLLSARASPPFGHFVKDYLSWHEAEWPDSHYRVKQIIEDHLLPTFEFRALDAITSRETEAWKQKRRSEGVKASTVGKELRTLKAVLNKAIEWEQLTRNRIESVSEPRKLDSKPPRFYTVPELAKLYEACSMIFNSGNGPQPDPKRAAVWRLYANTGLRRKEGLILKPQWIGRESMKILSTGEERTKSGKWREVPLTDGAKEALEVLGDNLVPKMTPPSLSRSCANDARRAGIGGGIHILRHTYISHLVMAAIPLRTVQVLAGHSSIAVTEKYAHCAPDYLQNAGRAISL